MKSLPHNFSPTGAGERVRGWVKTEMDVVVSAKEAEQARQQLIKERKTLAEEIQKLKVECRRTMTHQEMEETSTKQTDLQEQLDMRNLQISELQKEIMLAEQDKEKSGDRWAKMTSMTDSKIAVSFLFNSATEAMATATTRAREVTAFIATHGDFLTCSQLVPAGTEILTPRTFLMLLNK